jgi:hypothetical protein
MIAYKEDQMITRYFSIIKLSLPILLAGLLLLLVFGTALSAQIELLNDGFEKPITFESWDGNDVGGVNTKWLAHPLFVNSGSRSARGDFGAGYLSSDDLAAGDAVGIDVSFWFGKTDIGPEDFTLYYCYGANICNQVAELDPLGNDGVWTEYTDTITDTQYFTDTFFIRFDGTPPHSEYVYVDDILITKDTGETLTVSKTGNGDGTVTSTPPGIDCGMTCSATYNMNTLVTLNAVAAPGSTFTGWSGACLGTGVCEVTLNVSKSVIAEFTLDEYTLTVNVSGIGTVEKDPEQATYHYGDMVQLTAMPDTGWSFANWSGDLTGTTNPDTITITANTTVTTTFIFDAGLIYFPIISNWELD